MQRWFKTKYRGVYMPLRRKARVWRLLRIYPDHCYFCGCEFTPAGNRQRTFDHLVPKSKGGADRVRNLVLACCACNRKKGDKTAEEFVASQWLRARIVILEHEAKVSARQVRLAG